MSEVNEHNPGNNPDGNQSRIDPYALLKEAMDAVRNGRRVSRVEVTRQGVRATTRIKYHD